MSFPFKNVPRLPPITTLKEASAITVPLIFGRIAWAVETKELCKAMNTAPNNNREKEMLQIELKPTRANTEMHPISPATKK